MSMYTLFLVVAIFAAAVTFATFYLVTFYESNFRISDRETLIDKKVF